VLASYFEKKGALAKTALRFDAGELCGDIDLLVLWSEWLFVFECKAAHSFSTPDRTANLRRELLSEDPAATTAVSQVKKGLAYVALAGGRVADELGVSAERIARSTRVGGILLAGAQFERCVADGITIRNGQRLVRRLTDANALAAAFNETEPWPAMDEPHSVAAGGVRFIIHSRGGR